MITLSGKIILRTKHLRIREFTLDDKNRVYQMSREPGIRRWLPDQVYANIEEAKGVLEYLISKYERQGELNKLPYILGIELISTNELIGHIGLSPIEEGIEIGYGIEENKQGLGYATEAVAKFCPWALKEFDLDCIWGVVNKENKGSIKVLEKANFKYEKKDNNRLRYIFK